MPQPPVFNLEYARAARQPKTDRLILARLLKQEAERFIHDDEKIAAAQAILVRWADLETRGRLATFNETQLQGDFLSQVFGRALGYIQPTENTAVWYQEQHRSIAGKTP